MTTLYTTPNSLGRHRQAAAPHVEESVPQAVPTAAPAPPGGSSVVPVAVPAGVPTVIPTAVPAGVPTDPPIYTAVLSLWASQGRTLPGHSDQEWNRLAAGPVWAGRTVRVSGTLVRQGDAR